MASKRELADSIADLWDREARGYEQQAKTGADYSAIERRLLEMHARVKRACAQHLRIEFRKIARG